MIPYEFFHKILTQSVRVPELLEVQKYCRNVQATSIHRSIDTANHKCPNIHSVLILTIMGGVVGLYTICIATFMVPVS